VEKALNTQLLDIGDIRKAEGALIHIEGGDDMTLEDVNRAGELIISRISPNAKVAWGARINDKMTGTIRVTAVLAGVDSPFLSESLSPPELTEEVETEKLEVEVVKPAERKEKKGLFRKFF